MPNRCVVGECSNTPNLKEGISLYIIPFFDDPRPEAKKRRKKWVDFVSQKRVFNPSKNSVVCSKHFKDDDFTTRFSVLPGQSGKPIVRLLRRDEFGICVYPTKYSAEEVSQSDRSRRMILKGLLSSTFCEDSAEEEIGESSGELLSSEPSVVFHRLERDEISEQPVIESVRLETQETDSEPSGTREEIAPESSGEAVRVEIGENISGPPGETSAESMDNANTILMEPENSTVIRKPKKCSDCKIWLNKNRVLRNQILSLRQTLTQRKKEVRTLKRRESQLEKKMNEKASSTSSISKSLDMEYDDGGENENPMEVTDGEEENQEDMLYEPNAMGSETETETESEEDENPRVLKPDANLRREPKHIVFLTQLLLLFGFCHTCKQENPLVESRQNGTEVIVTTTCNNPNCTKRVSTWHSQPEIPGWGIPAGNFLLCMAILLAGGSATKVFNIFSHMGVGCISLGTFFRHQKSKLFPTIQLYWKRYQKCLLEKAKATKEGLIMAGDGRHDSMGHSAKYCSYSMFCCNLSKIIHFDLVQKNQAGSSPAMEFYGFKNCMNFLLGYGIKIKTFISDRHSSISKHMRTAHKGIKHYFDLWHLKKKIRSILKKISKEKGMEVISEWISPCVKHLHWCATTTFSGNGKVIWAKFVSFLDHVVNKHKNLADPLFNKCYHSQDIADRKWLKHDSAAYMKLYASLTNTRLKKGIMQASPLDQTSSLEGFHSVLNHFSPKMIAYSYIGQYCRHVLAVVHFNHNLDRKIKHKESDGNARVRVSYPKFKDGEATVREIRVTQNFDYVDEIYETFLAASEGQLKKTENQLKSMSPPPMNSLLEKQNRDDALKKRSQRRKMTTVDVPPTTPVSQVSQGTIQQGSKSDNVRRCTVCKNPMKGHKNVLECPRNQKT